METLKPQPSLRGFSAYALRTFHEMRGMTAAEGASWMIEHWIDEHYDDLAARYGITLESFAALNRASKAQVESGKG